MVWSVYCPDEKMDITAETKEKLATEVVQHLSKLHNKQMTYDQALEMVEREAKQKAA